jgi:hypothetical protein
MDHATQALNHRSRAMQALLLGGLLLHGVVANADEFSGYFDLGVRDVDVEGDENKYRQHVNLDSGPRLFGLGVYFEPTATGDFAPDRVALDATGLGGDPYQNVRAEIRKYGAYRFEYERRQSDYFYEDLLIDPADIDIEASNAGDFRTFDLRRVRDKATFDIHITDRAKLNLGFDRYERNGDSTAPIDVEREEFELDAPVDETLQNYDLGFQYDWDRVTLFLNQRWREFDNDAGAFLPGASEGSEPEEPTRLDYFFLDQPYSYDSSESQVGVLARLTDRWNLKADLFYADLEMAFDAAESSQGTDFLGDDFTRDIEGDGGADRETWQIFLSTSYDITDRVRLTASVRDQQLEQDATVAFGGSDGLSNWDIDNTGYSLGIEATVLDDWTLSGGWTGERRKTRYDAETEEFESAEDVTTKRDGFFMVVSYRPGTRWNLSFSAEDNGIDDPFTLASPTDTRRYRLRGSYRWDMGLSLTGSYSRRENENDETSWESNSEQADIRLTYDSEPISVSLGASFVEVDHSIDQLVVGGFRQDLFLIRYDAESDFLDGSVRWRATDWLDLVASFRDYQNEGSFPVERQDAKLGVLFRLPRNYGLDLSYRYVDFEEDSLEAFDADIWQASVIFRW